MAAVRWLKCTLYQNCKRVKMYGMGSYRTSVESVPCSGYLSGQVSISDLHPGGKSMIRYYYYFFYLVGIKTHTKYKHIQYKTKARDICLELKKFT